MPIQTVFLDAGGVLVNPNWSRINEVLARHGVDVQAAALAAAEPHAKKRLDTGFLAGEKLDVVATRFRSPAINHAGGPFSTWC